MSLLPPPSSSTCATLQWLASVPKLSADFTCVPLLNKVDSAREPFRHKLPLTRNSATFKILATYLRKVVPHCRWRRA